VLVLLRIHGGRIHIRDIVEDHIRYVYVVYVWT